VSPAERAGRFRSRRVVRAAGGIVVRSGPDGNELLLVHRPRYDDWSFPKGKVDAGESDEDAARREVEEETGLRCELLRELPSTHYVDGRGRPKRVRYWLMRVVDGSFSPNREVDEIAWLSAESATEKLTYEHDRALTDCIDG
jgi:8-oxo-dGTP diphosphatase